MRHSRRVAAAFAAVGAIALSQAGAAAALAEDKPITFSDPASLEIEYGQYWSFTATADAFMSNAEKTLTATGLPSGYDAVLSGYSGGGSTYNLFVAPSDVARALPVGSYSFSIAGTDPADDLTYTTATPAALKITAAKLGTELRVVADQTNGDNAIVTARFTGRFVDEYYSSFFETAGLSPAGVWKITVKDAEGTVVTEQSVERAAGDDVLATSFYFSDSKPGEQYTASATFTTSGASATNFTVTQPTDFDYTAPAEQRPVPTSTATAAPTANLPDAPDFSLPLWALIAAGILIAGLIALVIVFSVKLSGPKPASESSTGVQS